MSISLLAKAFDCPELPPGPRLVLLVLCDYANQEGKCWPGQRRIQIRTGFGRTTVITHSKWLVENGYLVRTRIMDSQYHYKLLPNNWPGPNPEPAYDDSTSTEPGQVQNLNQGSVGIRSYVGSKAEPYPLVEPLEETLDSEISDSATNNGIVKKKGPKKRVKKEDVEGYTVEQARVDFVPPTNSVAAKWQTLAGQKLGSMAPTLTQKDLGMLSGIVKAAGGEEYTKVMFDSVIPNWLEFITRTEAMTTAFDSPMGPSIPYLRKWVNEGLAFHVQIVAKATKKPQNVTNATKEPKKVHKHKSLDELLGGGNETD